MENFIIEVNIDNKIVKRRRFLHNTNLKHKSKSNLEECHSTKRWTLDRWSVISLYQSFSFFINVNVKLFTSSQTLTLFLKFF